MITALSEVPRSLGQSYVPTGVGVTGASPLLQPSAMHSFLICSRIHSLLVVLQLNPNPPSPTLHQTQQKSRPTPGPPQVSQDSCAHIRDHSPAPRLPTSQVLLQGLRLQSLGAPAQGRAGGGERERGAHSAPGGASHFSTLPDLKECAFFLLPRKQLLTWGVVLFFLFSKFQKTFQSCQNFF